MKIPYNVMRAPADMARGAVLERKDDTGGQNKDDNAKLDTKDAVRQLMQSWETYKTANDERLAAIEAKQTDPLADDKLAKIDGFLDKYEGLNQDLTMATKSAANVKALEEKFDELETVISRLNTGDGPQNEAEAKALRTMQWASSVVAAIQYGQHSLDEDQKKSLDRVITEHKAINLGTNTEGGYLAPTEFVREIIKAVTEISPVRSLARVRQTGAKSVEIPKRTGQFAAQWVSEQGTKSETTGLTWGVEEIPAHEFYALIDITNQMLEDAMFNMVDEIREESSEQFALAEGAVFVNGSGVGQPEGFMTNTDVGSTNSGSATTIADANGQANGLITLKYAIKSAYARNSTWLMNRTTMGSVRKLKSGDNNYIWMPGIAQGRPNTIDGDPYVEVPDMPSEGAGTFPIAYGDWRRAYTWIDRIQMEMLRDPYTQATGGKIRYIMRKRVGGKVTLAEAIRKLQCSA